jgi:hypothetical protein
LELAIIVGQYYSTAIIWIRGSQVVPSSGRLFYTAAVTKSPQPHQIFLIFPTPDYISKIT